MVGVLLVVAMLGYLNLADASMDAHLRAFWGRTSSPLQEAKRIDGVPDYGTVTRFGIRFDEVARGSRDVD